MSQGNEFNQKLTLLNTQILNNITVSLQDNFPSILHVIPTTYFKET